MDDQAIHNYFIELTEHDKNSSDGIAAIRTLLAVLEKTNFTTIVELINKIKSAVQILKLTGKPITSIVSASELFVCFITLTIPKLEEKTMNEIKLAMLNRGQTFLKKLEESRHVIAMHALPFITEGCRILTHARSRVVLETLRLASANNKNFQVYVTSSVDGEGEVMCEELRKSNIETTLILDSAIGFIMESIDFVMVGAEGVMESGGIINRIGTFTMALCAREMKKPFYVLTESFKFSRLFPLNQRDPVIPNTYNYTNNMSTLRSDKLHPLVDYTAPLYLSLIFSDLGKLTPSAVSDELIKLY